MILITPQVVTVVANVGGGLAHVLMTLRTRSPGRPSSGRISTANDGDTGFFFFF